VGGVRLLRDGWRKGIRPMGKIRNVPSKLKVVRRNQ